MKRLVYSSKNVITNMYVLDITLDYEISDTAASESLISWEDFHDEIEKLVNQARDYLIESGYSVDEVQESDKNTKKSISYYLTFYSEVSENVLMVNFRVSNHPDPNPSGHVGYLKMLAKQKSRESGKTFYTVWPKTFLVKNRTYASLNQALQRIIKEVDKLDAKKILQNKMKKSKKV